MSKNWKKRFCVLLLAFTAGWSPSFSWAGGYGMGTVSWGQGYGRHDGYYDRRHHHHSPRYRDDHRFRGYSRYHRPRHSYSYPRYYRHDYYPRHRGYDHEGLDFTIRYHYRD